MRRRRMEGVGCGKRSDGRRGGKGKERKGEREGRGGRGKEEEGLVERIRVKGGKGRRKEGKGKKKERKNEGRKKRQRIKK